MKKHQHYVNPCLDIVTTRPIGVLQEKLQSQTKSEAQIAKADYEFRLEIYQKMRSQIHAINAHVRTVPLPEMPDLPWFKHHLWIEHNDRETTQLLYGAFDKLKLQARRQLDVIALKHKKQESIADSTFDRFEKCLTTLLHLLKAASGESFGLELKLIASDIISPSGKKERIAQIRHDLDWALDDYLYIPKRIAKAGGLKLQCRRRMQGAGLPKRDAEASSYKTLMMAEHYGLLKPYYTRLRNYWVKILNNSSDQAIDRILFGNRFCDPRSDVIAIL